MSVIDGLQGANITASFNYGQSLSLKVSEGRKVTIVYGFIYNWRQNGIVLSQQLSPGNLTSWLVAQTGGGSFSFVPDSDGDWYLSGWEVPAGHSWAGLDCEMGIQIPPPAADNSKNCEFVSAFPAYDGSGVAPGTMLSYAHVAGG